MTDLRHDGNLAFGLPISPESAWRNRGTAMAPTARTMLVQVGPARGGLATRLFLRSFDERAYREIVFPAPIEIDHLTVSELGNTAFVWARFGSDANDRRILKISLPDGVVSEGAIPKTTDDYRRVWISQVYAASADGSFLYVKAGHEPFEPTNGSIRIEYKVGVLDVATGLVSPRTDLLTPYV